MSSRAKGSTWLDAVRRWDPAAVGGGIVVQLSVLVINRGGFYEDGLRFVQWSTLVLVVAALATRQRPVVRCVACIGPAVLAASALLSAFAAGDLPAGMPTLRALLAVAALGAVTAGLAERARHLLLDGLVLLAAVAVIIGIGAVIRRDVPEAYLGRDLWRAASTLWYPNALGALAGAGALIALARSVRDPEGMLHRSLAYVLLVGVVVTWSRGAALGVGAGLMVVAATLGVRLLIRSLASLVLGIGIFLVGYASVVRPGEANGALAWAGLVGGGLVVNALARVSGPVRRAVPAMALVAVVVAGGILVGRYSDNLGTEALEDRLDIWESAAETVAARPLLGAGPGQVVYVYRDGVEPRLARYAHNDYLELTVQQGLVGLGVALVVAGVATSAALKRRPAVDPATWAGVAGALTALAVHASLDFLSRFPLLLMVGAVLVAMLTTSDGQVRAPSSEG